MRVEEDGALAPEGTTRLTWPGRLLTLSGLVVLTFVAGLQPWLPVEDAEPPVPGPLVEAVAADVETVHTDDRCGPTVTAIAARAEAPDGIRAVRLSASKDGLRFTKGMVRTGDGYTSSLGPFERAGPVRYLVRVTDHRGRSVDSAPGRLHVRACP